MAQNVETGQGESKQTHPGRISTIRAVFSRYKLAVQSLLIGPKYEDWRKPWNEEHMNRYRSGYPLYSSWLARHQQFQNFRRFRTTRMRMLLGKQDAVVKLEEQLQIIDDEDGEDLFLGSMRHDTNPQRKQVLQTLDAAMKDYDEFLLRSKEILIMPDAALNNLHGMEAWLGRFACISRKETAYIRAEDWDVLNLCGVGEAIYNDNSVLANRIKNAIGELRAVPKQPTSQSQAQDLHNSRFEAVQITQIRAVLKTLTAIVSITLLLLPMLTLNMVHTDALRFLVIFLSTSAFVTALIFATPAGMLETLGAGAAYAAVLAVFVGESAVGGSGGKQGP